MLIGVTIHAHQLKKFHYPQVQTNVILSKKLTGKVDVFYESFDSRGITTICGRTTTIYYSYIF
ncbi:hypothetical protein EXW39_29625 (plasmid) [Bacillus mycoides]|nr:hypothetical protein EXW39_29625 [Bacillus mycoides]